MESYQVTDLVIMFPYLFVMIYKERIFMKKLIEIFGLGVLMILGGSLAEYTLSSFSVVFIYSGAFVLIWGLGLFYWKVIQKGMDWIKELKNISKE